MDIKINNREMKRHHLLQILAMIVFSLALLCFRSEDADTFDLSTWDENNVHDFTKILASIESLKNEKKDWPLFVRNEIPRRRLSEDKWSREQRQMQQEVTQFFKENGSKGTIARTSFGNKQKTIRRKEQGTLPPVEDKNCTDPNSEILPCPNENLPQKCDKYNNGNLVDCLDLCKISFCCTHDSTNELAESCANEPNCRNYIPCYILWWKLHDTVGPAPFFEIDKPSVNFPDFFNLRIDYLYANVLFEGDKDTTFYFDWKDHWTEFDDNPDDDDSPGVDDGDFEQKENWVSVQKFGILAKNL